MSDESVKAPNFRVRQLPAQQGTDSGWVVEYEDPPGSWRAATDYGSEQAAREAIEELRKFTAPERFINRAVGVRRTGPWAWSPWSVGFFAAGWRPLFSGDLRSCVGRARALDAGQAPTDSERMGLISMQLADLVAELGSIANSLDAIAERMPAMRP